MGNRGHHDAWDSTCAGFYTRHMHSHIVDEHPDASDAPVPPEKAELMRRIRQKNTAPEILVRRWLHAQGYRFRLHRRDLPGTPDIVLPRYRLAVFVHGCFWHRHPGCPRASTPKTRKHFWEQKFIRNVSRDRVSTERLATLGWSTLVVWGCQASSDDELRRAFEGVLPMDGNA
jgi:DNA mismatch endonuclease, patch repair protein